MDWVKLREKTGEGFRKYKYALLILAVGLLLMCLPDFGGGGTEEVPAETAAPAVESDLASELEQILSQIDGAGKVRVMLTESTGAQTYYQTDDDQSTSADSDSCRSDTVLITDADRAQNGLVRKTDPPTYRGAIVVCQGGDRPSVQLAVVEAVANVTGISADHITVLKMK